MVGLWKDVLKELFWVSENWIFKIGDDSRVRFKGDPWCGNFALKSSFTTLYRLAVNENETVVVWDLMVGNDLGIWSL